MISANAPTWHNPRILGTLLLVFLCGGTVGMVSMALGIHKWIHPSVAASAPAAKDGGKEVSLRRFKKELNLSPAQAAQLETVLDDFFMYYHTLQAQLDEVRADGKKRIVRILNDDQKRRFEQLMNEMQDKQLH